MMGKSTYRWRQWPGVVAVLLLVAMIVFCGGCSSSSKNRDSGDPEYESRVITIEGLQAGNEADSVLAEISVQDLRKLPQHELNASYKRTTGLTEEFKMSGPYLQEVVQSLGGRLEDYAGIGVVGRDDYYCLLSKEIIAATPDLMLAITIDGEARLDEENAPARLAVQGQFGPYWVKQVEKIILYKEIPEKNITSVWVFANLAAGIEPYKYEYYGSKDNAIDLEQVFSRLDHVDNKAFFTMKSSDGFKKNEVINMVKSRYYIKIEGADAPTNVSPYIRLGMNVQNIAWVSTNADAAIFPEKLQTYMEAVEIGGEKGLPLDEVLYETEVKAVKNQVFDLLGTNGEKITVSGMDLHRGILVKRDDGSARVVWDKEVGHKNINNLLRIRLIDAAAAGSAGGATAPSADTVLTITGDGISRPSYYSLAALQGMRKAYVEQVISVVNNFPTRKFAVAKGVNMADLLREAGIKSSARSLLVEAKDGYKASLSTEQLFGRRYCYPELLAGSSDHAQEVKPVLAWAYGEGQDLSRAQPEELRLVIGQQGLNDVNTAVSVRMISKITVSTKNPGRWSKPVAILQGGRIVLSHETIDQVKLYYTLNGDEPNQFSQVYNPSTTYFQPDLIQPIPVTGSGVLKVKAVGYGKQDSEVLTYAY